MSDLQYRELHTCPKCGVTWEIDFTANVMQSVLCDDCSNILERQVAIDEKATEGMTMIEQVDYFATRTHLPFRDQP